MVSVKIKKGVSIKAIKQWKIQWVDGKTKAKKFLRK